MICNFCNKEIIIKRNELINIVEKNKCYFDINDNIIENLGYKIYYHGYCYDKLEILKNITVDELCKLTKENLSNSKIIKDMIKLENLKIINVDELCKLTKENLSNSKIMKDID